jgi:two-component system response regulator YesN
LIGISQIHRNLEELNEAFRECSNALDQKKVKESENGAIWYQNSLQPRTLSWPGEDEFLFRIETGMKEEVQKLCDELFDWMSEIPGCTLGDVKYYCYLLSDQCRQLLNEYLKMEKKGSVSSMQNAVIRIFRLEDLKAYDQQFFLNIAELLKTENIYAGNDVIEKVKLYIQHNYQKELTQDFIASLFFLNRSYLSTLFKQRTGVKFIDYLNEVRIEKSREALKNSSRKMYQIAKSVGYDNAKYFFRVFKKKVGMIPEEFGITERDRGLKIFWGFRGKSAP